jgi:hypothetical protein
MEYSGLAGGGPDMLAAFFAVVGGETDSGGNGDAIFVETSAEAAGSGAHATAGRPREDRDFESLKDCMLSIRAVLDRAITPPGA